MHLNVVENKTAITAILHQLFLKEAHQNVFFSQTHCYTERLYLEVNKLWKAQVAPKNTLTMGTFDVRKVLDFRGKIKCNIFWLFLKQKEPHQDLTIEALKLLLYPPNATLLSTDNPT